MPKSVIYFYGHYIITWLAAVFMWAVINNKNSDLLFLPINSHVKEFGNKNGIPKLVDFL